MPYYLDNAFLQDNPWITVVGCGGTGGYVAEGLCRLFTGREATIVLVDHDRVEPHNLLRQNFYPEDVGHFKSQALADRLARSYGRPVGYSVYAFREGDSGSHGHRYAGLPRYGNCLLIGCTDNAAARRAMAACLRGGRQQWLIDAGNDTNWGQVLVGNVADPSHRYESAFDGQTCQLLPAPTLQRPDLLTAVPDTPPDVDCAAALDLTDQDPTINQMMASLVLMVVRRMAAGTCPFMGLYLDMELGTVTLHLCHPGGGEAGDEGEPPPSAKQRLTPWREDTLLIIGARNTAREETRRETMLDERGNDMTTTTWQDNHSGYRRHKLMTKELGAKIPKIGANEDVDDYDEVLARAKLFSPYTGWRWYITEWAAETGLCFGLVEGYEVELGYFDLTELAESTVLRNVPAVERDLYWEPKTIGEIRRQSR